MNSSKEADGGELHQLKSTLSQLSSQLELNPNSSDHEELLQLRDDLIQLIQLKEEQLLDDEKAALSALVHDLLQSSVIGDSTGSHVETCERPASAGSVTSDEESQWIGQRCSVPGWTSNGRFILQNAVVSGLVKEDGDSDQPATYARVFFAHPTRLSDAPCPQFVEHGTCHRGVRCRASHGKLVSIEELGPWHEPDVTKFSREGQLCLVKNNCNPYGLWRHARLLHADLDSQSCVVEWGHAFAQGFQSSAKRKSYTELEQSVANVSLDAVHLLSEDEHSDQDDVAEHEDVSSSSSDSDTSDGNEPANRLCNTQSISTPADKTHRTDALNLRSKVTFVAGGILAPEDILKAIPFGDPISDGSIPTTDSDVPDDLGAWEAHTRGIGSRLLAKLGYDGTSGLGSCGQGRTLPVALILEKFQIRPRKWNKRPTLDLLVRPEIESKRPRRQKRNLATVESSGHDSSLPSVEAGVFNLLNTALNRCDDDDVVGSKPQAQHRQSHAAQSGSRLTELSESASRIETFKVQEEIDRTLRKMRDVQQSIERNQNKDRVMAKQAEQRLNNLQVHLAKLRHSERVLQNSRQKVAKTKKLRIF